MVARIGEGSRLPGECGQLRLPLPVQQADGLLLLLFLNLAGVERRESERDLGDTGTTLHNGHDGVEAHARGILNVLGDDLVAQSRINREHEALELDIEVVDDEVVAVVYRLSNEVFLRHSEEELPSRLDKNHPLDVLTGLVIRHQLRSLVEQEQRLEVVLVHPDRVRDDGVLNSMLVRLQPTPRAPRRSAGPMSMSRAESAQRAWS